MALYLNIIKMMQNQSSDCSTNNSGGRENCNFRPKWREIHIITIIIRRTNAAKGNIYLDGLDLSLIDPADIRRDTGL